MKKLVFIGLFFLLILQGCEFDITSGFSINNIESEYRFNDYEGFLEVKKVIEGDDDYHDYAFSRIYDSNQALDIKTVFENVSIVSEARSDVEVLYFTVYKPKGDHEGPKLDGENGNLHASWKNYKGKAHGLMVIRVPEAYNGDLVIDTVSGEVDLMGVQSGEVEVESTSGDISLDYVELSSLTCDTTSGDVEVKGVIADRIYIETTSGKVRLDLESMPSTEIDSTSGDIDIVTEQMNGDLRIDSTSGDVELDVEIWNTDLDFDTTSGRFKSDVTLENPNYNGKNVNVIMGSGEYKIRIDTTSGDLRIE